MSEIITPDEDGGIDVGESVSFVIMPARSGKGVQACEVTFAEPPKKEEENIKPMGGVAAADGNGEMDWGNPASTTDAAANGNGAADGGPANGAGDTPAADPAMMDWGAWGQ